MSEPNPTKNLESLQSSSKAIMNTRMEPSYLQQPNMPDTTGKNEGIFFGRLLGIPFVLFWDMQFWLTDFSNISKSTLGAYLFFFWGEARAGKTRLFG